MEAPLTKNEIRVTRLEDGRVMVRKGSWRDVFPEERRLPWADWYAQMFAERGYHGYREMAEALRELPPVKT